MLIHNSYFNPEMRSYTSWRT